MSRGECDKYHSTIIQLATAQQEVRVILNVPYATMCVVGVLEREAEGYWRVGEFAEGSYVSFNEWQVDDIAYTEESVRIWLKTKDEVQNESNI